MSATGSATCPACARNVLLRGDGALRRHRTQPDLNSPTCDRSGTTPPTTAAAPTAEKES